MAGTNASSVIEAAVRPVCVARQPIFDSRLSVVAYELLYRSAPGEGGACVVDGTSATAQVVIGSVAEFGLEVLGGGDDVHVNLPRELIVDPVDLPLHPDSTVLEILETVRSDPDVLAGIRAFRDRGFRIALDDYVSSAHDEELVRSADIVKLDLLQEPEEHWESTSSMLLRRGLEVIAEKVETREQFDMCRRSGIQYFQGYWFQRPETFSGQSLASDRLTTLRVFSALQDRFCPMATLAHVVQQDLALVYRLLRVVNSGYYSLPRTVNTVQEALLLLGTDNLRRLCAVMALAAFDNRPEELLVSALIRARMCELLSETTLPAHACECFFAGLLSHLDALLGVPAEQAVRSLPLSRDIELAVTAYAGPMGQTLRAVVAFERGDWSRAMVGGAGAALSQEVYWEAIRWADTARRMLAV